MSFLLRTLRLWKVRLEPMAVRNPSQLKEACGGRGGKWWMLPMRGRGGKETKPVQSGLTRWEWAAEQGQTVSQRRRVRRACKRMHLTWTASILPALHFQAP